LVAREFTVDNMVERTLRVYADALALPDESSIRVFQ